MFRAQHIRKFKRFNVFVILEHLLYFLLCFSGRGPRRRFEKLKVICGFTPADIVPSIFLFQNGIQEFWTYAEMAVRCCGRGKGTSMRSLSSNTFSPVGGISRSRRAQDSNYLPRYCRDREIPPTMSRPGDGISIDQLIPLERKTSVTCGKNYSDRDNGVLSSNTPGKASHRARHERYLLLNHSPSFQSFKSQFRQPRYQFLSTCRPSGARFR